VSPSKPLAAPAISPKSSPAAPIEVALQAVLGMRATEGQRALAEGLLDSLERCGLHISTWCIMAHVGRQRTGALESAYSHRSFAFALSSSLKTRYSARRPPTISKLAYPFTGSRAMIKVLSPGAGPRCNLNVDVIKREICRVMSAAGHLCPSGSAARITIFTLR